VSPEKKGTYRFVRDEVRGTRAEGRKQKKGPVSLKAGSRRLHSKRAASKQSGGELTLRKGKKKTVEHPQSGETWVKSTSAKEKRDFGRSYVPLPESQGTSVREGCAFNLGESDSTRGAPFWRKEGGEFFPYRRVVASACRVRERGTVTRLGKKDVSLCCGFNSPCSRKNNAYFTEGKSGPLRKTKEHVLVLGGQEG